MTTRTWFQAAFVSLLALLAGCATSYRVTLESTAKPDGDAISYALRNGTAAEKEDSLRYREAAAHVRTALSGRGLYEAPPNAKPDVIVSIDYGMTSREQREMILLPRKPATLSRPGSGVDSKGERVTPKSPSLEQVALVTTTYEKYLRLTARENKPSGNDGTASDIWQVDVTSEGKSKNLREYLPILVAASIEYVGKDSHGQKSIRLKDTDADVVFVKKGM
jgi:hypothetical protein